MARCPSNQEDLYRLNRLCLRIYGLLSRDMPEQAKKMTDEAAGGIKKKQREILVNTLEESFRYLSPCIPWTFWPPTTACPARA